MANITITTIPKSVVIGVYDNLGEWYQADGVQAEKTAILDELPAGTGVFTGTIYDNGEVFEAPDQTVEASILFDPDDAGDYSGTVSTQSDAVDQSIDVSGTMLIEIDPNIEVQYTSMNFGNVNKSEGQKVLQNKIFNTGSENLTIDEITLDSAFSARTGENEYSQSVSGFTLGRRFNEGVDYWLDEEGRVTNNFSLTGVHIGIGNENGGLNIDLYDIMLIGGEAMTLNGEDIIVQRS